MSMELSSHTALIIVTGLLQTPICSTMELAKIRMQAQGEGQKRGTKGEYKGSFDCLRKIYKAEGIRGLGKGMNATILREVPAFGVYFVSYEIMCREFTPEGGICPTWGLLLAGGFAGCFSWMTSYPIDVIKSRLQVDGVYRNGRFIYKYNGYMDCIRQSVAAEGMGVFFRGLNSTLIRAFPTNAATFTAVAYTLRWLRPNETEAEKLATLERATLISQLEG